jgi:RNA polymerase sigma-70 factor (ECF subfamily)
VGSQRAGANDVESAWYRRRVPSESDIGELLTVARTRWSTIPCTAKVEARFRECVSARAEREVRIDAARAQDLYLACACAEGTAAALDVFEHEHLSRVPSFVHHISSDRDFADEVMQVLRARLFVGEADQRPRIVDYEGNGSLGGWVRVMAVRVALDLRRVSDRARRSISEDLVSAGAAADAAYVKRRYRAALQDAINRAVVDLTDEQRTLLRRHFVDGVTFDELAASNGVHKVTVWRKIAAARDVIVASMRSALGAHIGTSEFESILRTVQSQLDLSLATRR